MRASVALLLVGIALSDPATAQTAAAAIDRAKTLTTAEPCTPTSAAPDASVVVCASKSASERYRLPLPVERDPLAGTGAVRGEPRSAASVLVPFADCGPFAGQRNCSKAEARLYGYGGGRDPLTVGLKLLTRLIDPDAELGPPPATTRPPKH